MNDTVFYMAYERPELIDLSGQREKGAGNGTCGDGSGEAERCANGPTAGDSCVTGPIAE